MSKNHVYKKYFALLSSKNISNWLRAYQVFLKDVLILFLENTHY